MILLTCMNVIMYQMNVGVKWSNHVNSKMCRQRGAQPKSNFTKQDSLKMSLTIAFLLVMRNLAYIFCTLWSQLGIQLSRRWGSLGVPSVISRLLETDVNKEKIKCLDHFSTLNGCWLWALQISEGLQNCIPEMLKVPNG